MTKRLISLIVSVVLMLSLLAGCAGESVPDGPSINGKALSA